MRKTFIKSSVRISPIPGYYRKIVDRLEPQRNALLDAAIEKGDIYTHQKDSDERRKADKLTQKIRWAIMMNRSQCILFFEQREKENRERP